MATASPAPRHILARVAAGLLGSWAFVWGFVSLGITAQVAAGVDYEEAYTLAMLLAFLVLLAAFCWSFAAASITRVWVVLTGGAVLMTGAAWFLQRSLA